MTNLKLAVVGAGVFGRNHVRVLSRLPNVELIAVIDSDFGKAQQLAAEHGTQAFDSLSAIPAIDAAIVATPTVSHEEVATWLLEAGIDILVEKPIAISAAAGERLARLAVRLAMQPEAKDKRTLAISTLLDKTEMPAARISSGIV